VFDGLHRRHPHPERVQGGQREVQAGLVFDDPALPALAAVGVLVREDGDPAGDVGVEFEVVGVAVVPAVVERPPAEAHAEDEVAEGVAEDLRHLPGVADLAVAGVVHEEAQLGRADRHVRGDRQLPPGVAEAEECHPGQHGEGQVEHDLDGVVPGLHVQQAGFLDPAFQLGEGPGIGLGPTRERFLRGCAHRMLSVALSVGCCLPARLGYLGGYHP
jgi:hypothetical protein